MNWSCVFLYAGTSAQPSGLNPSEFSVPETTDSSDSLIGELECLDGSTTALSFSIAADVPFQLVRRGLSIIAKLERTAELDYDSGPSLYQFNVTCSDSLGYVTDTITVSIQPLNDNEPVFEITGMDVSIDETMPVGTVLVSQDPDGLAHITASDKDRGEDGILTFGFSPSTDDAIVTTHFSINETDGTISLLMPFDVDTDFLFSVDLSVVVCDGSRPSNTCPMVTLVVYIHSINEFDPQFSQQFYNTSQAVYSEGDYTDLVIATVECTDVDMGVGAFRDIQLHTLTPEPLFLVRLADGQANVLLNGTLDYEMIRESMVQVELLCSDDGEPARQDTAMITLYIQDLDDNLPQFSEDMYSVSVPESHPVHTQVLAVQCSDADYGAGALAGLQILNPSSDVASTFRIDAVSGIIALTKTLDYDGDLQSYKFQVHCTDTAGNGAVAGVNISVLGVNDEPVRFIKTRYEFTVDRLELPPDVVVGQVEAQDSDLGPQGPVSYSIEDNSNFDIDSDGHILLQDFILFLEGDHFRLNVTASDGENGDATTVVVVAVQGYLSVLDIVLIIAGALVLAMIIAVVCCSYCLVKKKQNK